MAARKPKTMGAWRDEAACLGEELRIFFPERNLALAREAKAICYRCPVRMECLDEALSNGERFGIWGGMDQDERRREARLRRNRRPRSTCETPEP